MRYQRRTLIPRASHFTGDKKMIKQITLKRSVQDSMVSYKITRLMNMPMWTVGQSLTERKYHDQLVSSVEEGIDVIVEE